MFSTFIDVISTSFFELLGFPKTEYAPIANAPRVKKTKNPIRLLDIEAAGKNLGTLAGEECGTALDKELATITR